MVIKKSIDEWLSFKKKSKNTQLGFVPTMGALHKGHLELVNKSLNENDYTLISIFVNPTQFNDTDDLKNYPNNLESDIHILENTFKKDIYLITPTFEDIYPDKYTYKIRENNFSEKLCGASRPGHFDGVLTIVMKLLNISGASKAYFGEKDFQQLKLIENMIKAFFMTIEIIPVKTQRDLDGLALSSRNSLLSPKAREKAPLFFSLLNSNQTLNKIKDDLIKNGFKIDYLEEIDNRRFGAVYLDQVRLIDNVAIQNQKEIMS